MEQEHLDTISGFTLEHTDSVISILEALLSTAKTFIKISRLAGDGALLRKMVMQHEVIEEIINELRLHAGEKAREEVVLNIIQRNSDPGWFPV